MQSVSNSDNSNTTYSYNADGQRIAKAVNSANGDEYNYVYYYNGDILAGYKLVITKSDGSSTTHNVAFMYDENGEAFGIDINGKEYFYVKNAQNDVIAIVNSNNETVATYRYNSWGKLISCEDTSENQEVSFLNPYTYRSYFYDSDTEMYFLKSRYYNPELHRFISADSVLDNRSTNTLNQFAYCANNPIINVDNNGEFFVGALVGGIIGGACGALNAAISGKSIKAGLITGAVVGAAIGFACDVAATGGVSLGLCVAFCGSVALMGNVVNQYCNYKRDKKNAKNNVSYKNSLQSKNNRNNKNNKNKNKNTPTGNTKNFASYIDYKSVAVSAVSAMVFAPISVVAGSVANSALSGLETASFYNSSQIIVGFATGGNVSVLQEIAELFIGEVIQ